MSKQSFYPDVVVARFERFVMMFSLSHKAISDCNAVQCARSGLGLGPEGVNYENENPNATTNENENPDEKLNKSLNV
jgi:hypothetical protein